MVLCFAPGCNHYSEREKCKFVKFPTDRNKLRRWCKLIRREDREPTEHSLLCSCHFKYEDTSRDPQIFEHNKNKILLIETPKKRTRKSKSIVQHTDAQNEHPVAEFELPFEELNWHLEALGEPVLQEEQYQALTTRHEAHDVTESAVVVDEPHLPQEQYQALTTRHEAQDVTESAVVVDKPHLPQEQYQALTTRHEAQDVTESAVVVDKPHLPQEQYQALTTRHEAQDVTESAVVVDKPHLPQEQYQTLTTRHEAHDVTESAMMKLMDTQREHEQTRMSLTNKSIIYSIHSMNDRTIRMETGLPNLRMVWVVIDYCKRFKEDLCYFLKWKVSEDNVTFENQVFICLMKLKQNYTNLHLSKLFGCGVTTIRNIFMTILLLLHHVFKKMINVIPSIEKNIRSAPLSFKRFPNCRIVIDCTDVRIDVPPQMDIQSQTYSAYRGMNSFKILVGVAPNGVITFISKPYPGSISDKMIVSDCGLLDFLIAGDMVMADKGFTIHDIIPSGVTLNIPPFLHGKFTQNEVLRTQQIARCRIHVERANERLKNFKILSLVPFTLRPYIDIVVEVIACLVNLQGPLIKNLHDNSDDNQ